MKSVREKGLFKSFGLSAHRPIVTSINSNSVGCVTSDKIKAWEKQIRGLDKFDEYRSELLGLIQLVKADPSQVVKGLSLNLKDNWIGKRRLLEGSKTPKTLATALEAVEG